MISLLLFLRELCVCVFVKQIKAGEKEIERKRVSEREKETIFISKIGK